VGVAAAGLAHNLSWPGSHASMRPDLFSHASVRAEQTSHHSSASVHRAAATAAACAQTWCHSSCLCAYWLPQLGGWLAAPPCWAGGLTAMAGWVHELAGWLPAYPLLNHSALNRGW